MDKLKYIKLENPDGSYSDTIPLAVDSDHVDVNGFSLTSIIEKKADTSMVRSGIDSLESKIENIASGSPAGTYKTVAALIANNPDHNKIYVVTDNGHWYYYDTINNTWTDGGLYQAVIDTELSDGSDMSWKLFSSYEEDYTPSLIIGQSYSITTGEVITNKLNRARTNRISIINRGDIIVLDSLIYEMDIFYYSSYTEELVNCFIESPGMWKNRFWASKTGSHYTLVFRRKDDANLSSSDLLAIQTNLHFYRCTDSSLLLQNVPADAKTVGEKIIDINNNIANSIVGNNIPTGYIEEDCIIGEYYGSNSGTIQTDVNNTYACFLKRWLDNIILIKMLDNNYVIRALFYDNQGSYLNQYSPYTSFIQFNNENECRQIGINVRKADSTEITDDDVVNIINNLKFYSAVDNSLSVKNVGADAKNVGIEKTSNDFTVVSSDLYTPSTYSYLNINYSSKMWHHGYLVNDGGGYDGSFHYITLLHGLDYIKGSTPSAVKIKIKDTSILSYPYIRIGWYDISTNIILDTVKGETEVVIPIPTYPYAENSSGGLVVTVGRFKTDATDATEMNYRANEWADENIEITLFYQPILKNRKQAHPLRGNNHINDYLYNAEFEYALKLPVNYTAYTEQKTPLVILCHGLSSTLDENHWGGADMIKLVKVFTNNGYAVMDVNRITSADWCNPALVQKYRKAIDYIIKHYNVEVQYIFAESMGCLISLALQQAYKIKAMVIAGLRLDFKERYSEIIGESKTIINTNLGLDNGWDKNIMAMYAMTECELIDEDNERINYKQFPPILFIEGTADTTNQEASRRKVKAIQRGGTVAKLSTYTGDHHTVCYLLAEGSDEEAIEWFETWK